MKRSLKIFILALVAIIVTWFFVYEFFQLDREITGEVLEDQDSQRIIQEKSGSSVPEIHPADSSEEERDGTEPPTETTTTTQKIPRETVLQMVPFISQAPSSQWSDPIFQNACEEASMIMAARWAENRPLGPLNIVEEEIRTLSAEADERFGVDSYDTSAEDTAILLRDRFNITNASVVRDASLSMLRQAIEEGSVIIVPADGRSLANPHYHVPGPEHHMLVIIGYDPDTREFITNDPGTRFGASWRYGEEHLYDSIRDYPTGNHLPVTTREKTIIVITKKVGKNQ